VPASDRQKLKIVLVEQAAFSADFEADSEKRTAKYFSENIAATIAILL
jgi:hypothetical protein